MKKPKTRCEHMDENGTQCENYIPKGLDMCFIHDKSICTWEKNGLRACRGKAVKDGLCINHQPKLEVEHQAPPVEHQAPAMSERNYGETTYLPEGEALPRYYEKKPPVPCPRCRALKIQSGNANASHFRTIIKGEAYFRCRACGKKFSLPVKEKKT